MIIRFGKKSTPTLGALSRVHRRICPWASRALFAAMSAPSPNQIRFAVEPRLVPAQKAARRLHLTEAEFKEKLDALVRAGMPAACSITGHYDLKAIDVWLDARAGIGEHEGEPKSATPEMIMERLKRWKRETDPDTSSKVNGVGQKSFEPWTPRKYAPGEWEEIIRGRKLQKREQQSLGAYYRAMDSPPSVLKGAGYATVERLIARGYIVSVDPNPEAHHPICKITPEGEAAWLAMSGEKDDAAKG